MKTTISTLNSGEYQVEINAEKNAHGEKALNSAFSKGLRFSSCLLRSDDASWYPFPFHSPQPWAQFFLRKKIKQGAVIN